MRWAWVLAAALVVSVVLAITFGPADITAVDVWLSVLHHLGLGDSPLSTLRDGIVWHLRLPRTLTTALHDLNLATQADQVVVLAAGRVVAAGTPETVLTSELIGEVYGVTATVLAHPATGAAVIAFQSAVAPTQE